MKEEITTNQTHVKLLAVATDLFNKRGVANTKLRDIANELQITENALYHYVEGKRDLAFQCYLAAVDRRKERLAIADGQLNGLAQVMLFVEASLAPNADPSAVMVEIPWLTPTQRLRVNSETRGSLEMLAAVIQRGIDDGSVRAMDAMVASFSIVSMLDWVPIWFVEKKHDAVKVQSTFMSILRDGVATSPLNFGATPGLQYVPMRATGPANVFDRDTLSAVKREQILRAASEVVVKQGIGGTTIRAVADSLGLTMGAIYHYFKNRDELVYECLVRSVELGHHCRALALEQTTDPLLRYCLFQYFYRIGHGTDDGPIPVLTHVASLPKRRQRQLLHAAARIRQFADDCITQAIAAGSVKPLSSEYARHAMSGMTNWLGVWYATEGRLSLDQIARVQIDLWADGLKRTD